MRTTVNRYVRVPPSDSELAYALAEFPGQGMAVKRAGSRRPVLAAASFPGSEKSGPQ